MRSRYEEGVLQGLHLAEEHILLRAEFARRRTGSGDMIGPMEELAKEIGQLQVQVMTGVLTPVEPERDAADPSADQTAGAATAQKDRAGQKET